MIGPIWIGYLPLNNYQVLFDRKQNHKKDGQSHSEQVSQIWGIWNQGIWNQGGTTVYQEATQFIYDKCKLSLVQMLLFLNFVFQMEYAKPFSFKQRKCLFLTCFPETAMFLYMYLV